MGRLKYWLTWGRLSVISGLGLVCLGVLLLALDRHFESLGPLLSGLLLAGVGGVQVQTRQQFKRLTRLSAAMDSSDLIVIATDRRGVITGFNAAASRALGYQASEVLGQAAGSIFRRDHDLDEALDIADRTGEAAQRESYYVRKDGTTFPAIVTVNSILNDRDRVVGHYEIAIDISERKANEQALHDKQELLESIAATSPTIFYTFDLKTRKVLYSSRDLVHELGYPPERSEEPDGDPMPVIVLPEALDNLFSRYEACMSLPDGRVLETEFCCLSADQQIRWLTTRDVIFKRDAEGRPTQILVNVVDVTNQKELDTQVEDQWLLNMDKAEALRINQILLEEAKERFQSLASIDGLTGIANHRTFQESLSASFLGARKNSSLLSLLLLDVDRFKDYNDTYGHQEGDVVLKRVAEIITDTCPPGCLPARYGGEEFAIICHGLTEEETLELGQAICVAIASSLWPHRTVTVSIGAASLTASASVPSDVVECADIALYRSKSEGRNRITSYEPGQYRPAAA